MNKSKISLKRLAFVTYHHTNIEALRQFNLDFGLQIAFEDDAHIYWAGYGNDPYCNLTVKGDRIAFGGASWLVESRGDLEKAAGLPGATAIESLKGPGGGEVVRLKDYYGIPMQLVYGLTEKEIVAPQQPVLNSPADKSRLGEFQRFAQGPAAIHKLGHFGYLTNDFRGGMEWYTSHFNLRYADVQEFETPGGEIVEHSAFFCLDKGAEYVDHHCFFLISGPPGTKTVVHHSSYEISDFDRQLLGHQWLQGKGYELSWGVGRHVLGSQIFDYWFDSTGFRVEHYVDGDVINSKNKAGRHRTAFGQPPSQDELAVWAQEPLSPSFTSIKVT